MAAYSNQKFYNMKDYLWPGIDQCPLIFEEEADSKSVHSG